MNFELRTPQGKKIPLSKALIKIGRDPSNDVIIKDPSVSRYHLNFYVDHESVIIENQGSSATRVNGSPLIGNTKIKLGDQIRFGNATLYLAQAGEELLPIQLPKKTENSPLQNKSAAASMDLGNVSDISKSKAPSGGINKRYLIYGGLALLCVLLFLPKNEETENKQAVEFSEEHYEKILSTPLPAENLKDDPRTPRGELEITAEDSFRKGHREYHNGNYVKAINYFDQALSENPALGKAVDFKTISRNALERMLYINLERAERNLGLKQYRSAKALSMQILTIIMETVPGYSYKVQQRSQSSQHRSIASQDDVLMGLPCEESSTLGKQEKDTQICNKAKKILKRSRIQLGDEEILQ